MIRVTVPRPVAEALMDGSLRLLVVEDAGHNWSYPPPDIVRAVEAGERIGIDVECETCHGRGEVEVKPGLMFPCGPCGVPDAEVTADNAFEAGSGRVPVGSVRPVRVLPITDDEADDCPGVAHLFVLADAPFDDGHRVFGCVYAPCDVSEPLSVYGDPESLIGKFAVVCEDARREP